MKTEKQMYNRLLLSYIITQKEYKLQNIMILSCLVVFVFFKVSDIFLSNWLETICIAIGGGYGASKVYMIIYGFRKAYMVMRDTKKNIFCDKTNEINKKIKKNADKMKSLREEVTHKPEEYTTKETKTLVKIKKLGQKEQELKEQLFLFEYKE